MLNVILSLQALCLVRCRMELFPLLVYKALAHANGPLLCFSLPVIQTVPADFSLTLELKLVCASAVALIISMRTVFLFVN